MKHRAAVQPGTQRDSHALCTCGRIIQLNVRPRTGLNQEQQRRFMAEPSNWYWRHVTDPTSSMVPAALRREVQA